MRVRWTAEAEAELAQAQDWGREHCPGQVELMTAAVLTGVARLQEFPNMGRSGQVPNTRQLVVGRYPFILIYASHGDELVVIRLHHHARQWPAQGEV